MVKSSPPGPGRTAQKRRTRKAIVDATIELLLAGHTPTMDEVATAADVSRRTVYLYFPTLDQLLLDAALGAATEAGVEKALGFNDDDADVRARVDALAHTLLDSAPEPPPLGRQIMALTVTSPREGASRGHRRIKWIEEALEPLRGRLTDEQYQRLVSSLAVVIGWEAMVVLRDIRALD